MGTTSIEVLAPDYNIAPSKLAGIITLNADGMRVLDLASWGLIPSWAKEASISRTLTNARSETAAKKPSFRGAMARTRCIVPVQGYYEWYRPAKQPFYIHSSGGETLAVAGLYELWRDPKVPDSPPRLTFTILTREPIADIAMIHDRMPVLLPPGVWSEWLDPATSSERTAAIVDPVGPTQLENGSLDAYPVATTVNSVRNNGPSLINPVAAIPPGDTAGLW